MLLYHKTNNSTIMMHKSVNGGATIHFREWENNQPIRDAKISLDNDSLDALIKILQDCLK